MAKDLIYYYPKRININRDEIEKLLGEVQQNFNMGFTLDGTKDSVHFQVVSYTVGEALKPFTILYHNSTKTPWIVSHDKVVRYMNETGYMYVHEIDCLGLVELLNARDLTDCGFRSNKYTIENVLDKLFKLSNFEYEYEISYQGIDQTQIVDYIKTFENYTLFSAIREFLNGYNCSIKAMFQIRQKAQPISYYIKFYFVVLSKNGSDNYRKLSLDDFKDVRETRNIDKNSFGTTVITNAQNVSATKVSVFPSVGTTRLSSQSNVVVNGEGDVVETACIRLPSNAYKVNKLSLCSPRFTIRLRKEPNTDITEMNITTAYDDYGIRHTLNILANRAENMFDENVKNIILNNIDKIIEYIKQITTYVFYDDFLYDAMNDEFKSQTGKKLLKFYNPAVFVYRNIILTDKITRDSLARPYEGIYWERGSNLIKGFEYFGYQNYLAKQISTDYSIKGDSLAYSFNYDGDTYKLFIDDYDGVSQTMTFDPYDLQFIVEYIPMTDLKIKVDNNNKTRDIKLYNQSGKLNDSVSLSKLINSYSNEIESENIVRYGDYYVIDDVPSVGQLVDVNGVDYMINSVSMDFYQNDQLTDDEVGYKIECEFSMSKRVAVKSLMVNANSNIRDYGIPQTNNVERKQVYRDTYQFSTDDDILNSPDYIDFKKLISFPVNYVDKNFDYMAFIRCKAENGFPTYTQGTTEPTGTTDYAYFQLQTTRFNLKKQIIYKINFNDNNIIGYDSQNVASGWSVNNLLYHKVNNINTPISYVDKDGELEGITVHLLPNNVVGEVYSQYAEDKQLLGYIYIAQRVYIDEDMYNIATGLMDFSIVEESYYKDALEVPVFEVCCQVVDNNSVVVGENIFDTFEEFGNDIAIFYGYAYLPDNAVISENNAMLYATNDFEYFYENILFFGYKLENTCSLEWDTTQDNQLNINLYEESKSFTLEKYNRVYNFTRVLPEEGKNIAIYRYVFNKNNHTTLRKDLLFVIKDLPMPTPLPQIIDISDNASTVVNVTNFEKTGPVVEGEIFATYEDDEYFTPPDVTQFDVTLKVQLTTLDEFEVEATVDQIQVILDENNHPLITGTFYFEMPEEYEQEDINYITPIDYTIKLQQTSGGEIKIYYGTINQD